MHTTNYYDSFIAVAEDCPVETAEIPQKKKDEHTVASMQFEMISHHPYKYSSDELLFEIFAVRNDISSAERKEEKDKSFSKGQPCLRSSPLAKRYGWGVHSNADGRIAIYAVESEKYREFENDKSIKQLKAMRSKRS